MYWLFSSNFLNPKTILKSQRITRYNNENYCYQYHAVIDREHLLN